jgi:Domain of unknown function (DUF2017)
VFRDQRRVRPARGGQYQLRLPPVERDLLRSLPGQLRAVLGTQDPALERLFPPAYRDDPEKEAEYRALVRDDLLNAKVGSLDVMAATIDAERLDEEQLLAWLGSINDLRLVLGTRLGVTEDLDPDALADDDPATPAFALYFYLGWLQEQVVEALASGVDPAGTEPA